jgi:diadenosine tetraphosphatase ApaH/serine/threonine PP2A family protein phosphatase
MAENKKIAVLGDVHGNLEALQAVMEDARLQRCNQFVCVGDIVGYNANPAECLELIRQYDFSVVRGNHDHYCSNDERLEDFHPLAAKVMDWTRQQLSSEQLDYLRHLPLSTIVEGFTLVHSTLDMPEKWGYVFDALDADASFNYQTTALCFHGHTHLPVAYEKQSRVTRTELTRIRLMLGKRYFINAGSVGQPRDGDPRAAYAIYDTRTRDVELRRLRYDIQKAAGKIVAAGLPERLAKRLEVGK